MKQLTSLITLCLLCLSGSALADVPASMNVQGRLTDSLGESVGERFMEFSFRIFDAQVGGTKVWPVGPGELHTDVYVDSDGVWNARVGELIPLTDSVFLDTARWLEVAVGDSANPAETLPRIKLNTNPYSYRAAWSQKAGDSELLNGFTAAAFADSGHGHSVTTADIVDSTILFQDIGQNGAAIGQILKWNGSAWAVADDLTSTGPAPTNLFLFSELVSNATKDLFTASVATEITGIWVSAISGGNAEFRLDGSKIILLVMSGSQTNAYWSRNDGAGILIPAGSVLWVGTNGAVTITITGFTY